MFDRKVLKSRAKAVLATSYWPTLASMLIVTALTGLLSNLVTLNLPTNIMLSSTGDAVIFAIILLMSFLLPFAAGIFLSVPLQVGLNKFALDYAKGYRPDMMTVFSAFRSNYKNNLSVILVKELIILALMLIPALAVIGVCALLMLYSGVELPSEINTAFIQTLSDALSGNTPVMLITTAFYLVSLVVLMMKMYDYYLVEFILAEGGAFSWKEVLSKSKQMMRGNRLGALVLGLSFIGWELLAFLICGIGAIFVAPYILSTNAQLYLELSGKTNIEQ